MTTKSSLLFFIISSVVMAPCISQAACTNNQQLQADSTFPKITGWVAYHTYMTYGDGSARLYLYDGPTKTSKQVNLPSWNISDPMNPNFSPNGKYIAFMGKQGGAWNNFVWEINTNTMPLNLTAALGGRNEDPKFSFDGKQIYFKHDFDIVIANLTYSNDKITGVSGWKYITNDRWNAEDSMPYPTPSGKYILYTIGSTALSIYRMNTQTGVRQLLTPTPADAHDYYPTVRDYSTYFFTRGVPVRVRMLVAGAAPPVSE